MWHENFELVEDPYSISDPYSYPSMQFFEWNRDDLNRSQLEQCCPGSCSLSCPS